jgi:predicted transcriptional regulator
MKSKAMIINFKNLDDLEKELLSLGKKKVPQVQSKNVIFFDSVASFRNFMTLQKLEILTMIAFEKPKSIYELTQMLDRGLAPVQKECQMLEKAGFIKLEREKTGRGSLKPRLAFDYDRLVVQLPEHPYELQFKSVA